MSRFIAPRPRMQKLTVPASKPRNPLVAAALMRQAGSHHRGKDRQQAAHDLRKQLADIGDHSP